MAVIRFSCTQCGHILKVGEDKAGKKAKCPKCFAPLTIPAASKSPAEGVKAPSSPPASPFDDEDDDGGGLYTFAADEGGPPSADAEIAKMYERDDDDDDTRRKRRLEEEEEEVDEEELEKQRQRRKARLERLADMRKAKLDVDAWEKVRLGIMMFSIGTGFWILALVLIRLVPMIGFFGPLEYGTLAKTEFPSPDTSNVLPGENPTLQVYRLMIGTLGSISMLEFSIWMYRVGMVLTLIRLLIDGIGMGFCIAAPPRYGTRGLAIATLIFSALNLLLVLFLQLLPTCGAIPYFMVQYITPEVCITETNIGRMDPLHITWSWAPFWESILALVLTTIFFAEPVLFYIFLRAAARSIRDEKMEETANTLIQLGLGVNFIFITFMLLAHSGTSEVLVNILRVVFVLATSFYLWQLIWTMIFCENCRKRIEKALKLGG